MNATLFRIIGGVLGPVESLSVDDCDLDAEKMVRRAMAAIARGEPGAGFNSTDGVMAVVSVRSTKGKGSPLRYFCVGEELAHPNVIGFVVPAEQEVSEIGPQVEWLLDLCLSVSPDLVRLSTLDLGQDAVLATPPDDPQSLRAIFDRLWRARPCLVHAVIQPASTPDCERLIARLAKTMGILWYLDAVV